MPAGTLMTFMHGLRLNVGEDWVKQVSNFETTSARFIGCVHDIFTAYVRAFYCVFVSVRACLLCVCLCPSLNLSIYGFVLIR